MSFIEEDVSSAFSDLLVTGVNPLAEKLGDWSDDIVLNLAKDNPLANPVGDGKWVGKFARQWFNLLYGDLIHKEIKLVDMIAQAMSLACIAVSNSEIVSIWVYTSHGTPTWYKAEQMSQNALIGENQGTSVNLSKEYLRHLTQTQTQEEILQKYHHSDQTGVSKFREKWTELIEETEKGDIDKQFMLSNLIAYTAAVALRSLSKDEDQMSSGYLKKNFQDNIMKIANLQDLDVVPAPCQNFIKRINRFVTKGNPVCKILLAHCLSLLLETKFEHYQNTSPEAAKTFVKAACLTHLEHNGLAVCSLFIRCMKILPSTAKELADNLNCAGLKPSLLTLARVLRKYEGKSKTWWWSRCFDDGYLAEMSSKDHSLLIAVLSFILLKKSPLENEGITQSMVLRRLSTDDSFKAQTFAEAIVEVCYGFQVEVKNSKVGQRMQAMLNEKKSMDARERDNAKKDDKDEEEMLTKLQESLKKPFQPADTATNSKTKKLALMDGDLEIVKIQKKALQPGSVMSSMAIPGLIQMTPHTQPSHSSPTTQSSSPTTLDPSKQIHQTAPTVVVTSPNLQHQVHQTGTRSTSGQPDPWDDDEDEDEENEHSSS